MNCIKLTFSFISPSDLDDEMTDFLWCYLGCLYKNGQIYEDYNLIKGANEIYSFVTLPEEDSLDVKYNNRYINEYYSKLNDLFRISIENIGINLDLEPSCKCKEPSWYLLYTDFTTKDSPVVCGDCGKSVPLYKMPYLFKQEEHFSEIGWQGAYQSIDKLWMYCLSDRFTYRQLNDPESQLSKTGREICTEFEKAVGKPFYYYLFHSRHTPKVCPVCGADWSWRGEKTFIDFKCENCRLVADDV